MSTAGDLMVRLLLNTNGFDRNLQSSTRQIQDFQYQMSEVGKTVNSFGQGLGINIGQLTKFTSAAGVAATAGKVLSDTFLTSAQGIDSFNRSIEGAKGAYEGFCNSLRNGDWGNFLSNIESAVENFEKLYDAIDALNTYKMFAATTNATYNALLKKWQNEYNINRKKYGTAKANEIYNKHIRDEYEPAIKKDAMNSKTYYKDVEEEILKNIANQTGSSIGDVKKVWNTIFRGGLDYTQAGIVKATKEYITKYEGQTFETNNRRTAIGAGKNGEAILRMFLNPDNLKNGLGEKLIDAVAQRITADSILTQGVPDMYKKETPAQSKSAPKTNNAPTPKENTPYDAGKKISKEEFFASMHEWVDTDPNKWSEDKQKEAYFAFLKLNDVLDKVANKLGLGIISKEEAVKTNSDAIKRFGDALIDLDLGKEGREIYRQGESYFIKYDAQSIANKGIELDVKDKSNYQILESLRAQKIELQDYIEDKKNRLSLLNVDDDEIEKILDPVHEFSAEMIEILRTFEKNTALENKFKDLNVWFNQTSLALHTIGSEFDRAGEKGVAFAFNTMSALSSLISTLANMVIVDAISGAAKIPYPANIAAIATTVSTVASIVGNAMNTFAGGGIVQGSGSGWSDSVAVRVSNGEMILNRRQQGNLFALLDGNRVSSGSLNGDVRFRLQGRELIGLINNETNKQNKVL